jgi:3-oxoadipate enol-lactonase
MLSHSLATNLEMWWPQVPDMSTARHVLRYDVRGHGDTDVTDPPYSIESLVADAIGLMDSLEVARVHFVGISLGGMIGQALAAAHSDRLASLVLCDTSSRTEESAVPVWDDRIELAMEQGMEAHVGSTIGRWFTRPFVESHPEVVDRVRAMIRSTDPRGYAGCAAVVKTLDLSHSLPRITAPTLLIVGEEDPGSPPEAARAIQRQILGSKLVVLGSASHLSNIEQPEAFNRVVIDFIEAVESSVGAS